MGHFLGPLFLAALHATSLTIETPPAHNHGDCDFEIHLWTLPRNRQQTRSCNLGIHRHSLGRRSKTVMCEWRKQRYRLCGHYKKDLMNGVVL